MRFKFSIGNTKFVLIALMPFFLSGCSKYYSVDTLKGTYVLNTSTGLDIIDLKENGTYTHTFKTKKGATASQAGLWQLEYLDVPTVTLDDFRSLPDEITDGQGFFLLGIRSSFGQIYLITNPDLDEGYEKQS